VLSPGVDPPQMWASRIQLGQERRSRCFDALDRVVCDVAVDLVDHVAVFDDLRFLDGFAMVIAPSLSSIRRTR